MAEGTRGPIKAGTGYIEVVVKLVQKEMSELRKQVTTTMERVGAEASKEISQAVAKGLSSIPKEAQKQAKKARTAVEGEAKDTAETIAGLEKLVTKQYGEQAAKRLKELREFYAGYEKLTEEASATTKAALRETVRQEEQAAKSRLTAERERVRQSERLAREERQEQERQGSQMARDTINRNRMLVQAYAENERRKRAEILQTQQLQRRAAQERVAQIRAETAESRRLLQDRASLLQTSIREDLTQIRNLRRSIADSNTSTSSYFTQAQRGLKNMGGWFHEVGTSITEAGNLLTTKFLAPLTLAGSALTTIGVANADKRLLGQLGLSAAGVSKGQSAKQMSVIQQYAIDTPFSIDVMHEYQMRLIRSVAGADKNWYSNDPGTRTTAANKAAGKTTDLIMAIGDSMARAGNLDPEMFRRAMYAMDMILDQDRAPTRNLKQLATASGMPASELAQLLGFKNSRELWKVVGTPANQAKKGQKAGVSGTEIMNALLNYWNPQEYGGKQSGTGSLGFAEKMTSQTITGRLQQMKEQATFALGNLFVKEGKGGQYEYTGLGKKLMGEQIPVYGEDRKGNQTITGYRTEGGILNQVQDLAKKYAPDVEKFLGEFLDGLSRFISMIDRVTGWLKSSGLDKVITAVAKFLAQWGPLVLAVGLLTKLFGKVVGIGGKLIGGVRAVRRGTASAVGSVRNAAARRTASADARRAARDAGGTRRDARQAGRQAARDARTQQRGTSSLDVDTRQAEREIRRLEDQVTATREEAARLRDEMRDLNHESLRQIAEALGGRGDNSVGGAATSAQSAVNQVQQQVQQTNRSSLAQLEAELEKVKKAGQSVVSELNQAHDKATLLDAVKFTSLHSEIRNLKTEAEHVGQELHTDGGRVDSLDGKDLKKVTASVRGLKDEANDAGRAIGNGAMSASVAGRVELLSRRRLTDLIDQFRKLKTAADNAAKAIGTAKLNGTVAGRISDLNDATLKDIKKYVDDLKKALDKAGSEAHDLDGKLDDVDSHRGSGSSSSKGKKSKGKRNARGGPVAQADVGRYGVLPGYAPWVDNIPAILSPGEAVLRPEVAHAIGDERINAWNAMAIRGQISRHARGSGGRFNLDDIKALQRLQSIRPIGEAMAQTMVMDSASNPLGGSTRDGVLGSGDSSARYGGIVTGEKVEGMYDWITHDVYKVLRKVPDGVSQIAGILGGALGPTMADYFWDDVWQGDGNIVQRGKRYFNDVFSMKTLGKVWDNLYSGTTESLGAIWDTVTNPIDTLSGAFGDIYDVVTGSYDNLIGMISTVKGVVQSPKEYGTRVASGYLDEAKESLPNMDGLFDFSNGSTVSSEAGSEEVRKLFAGYSAPIKGVGGAEKWKNVAMHAMTMNGIPASTLPTVLHRINLESGGNPLAVNKSDINWKNGTPSVGLMQVIGPTFGHYAGPFRGTQPQMYGVSVDPLANIYAGLNYAKNRYGSRWQSVLAGNTGYATGTLSASPGLAMVGEKGRELVAFGGGERVFTHEETEGILNGKKYEIHVHEARSEPTPQAVLRALQTAEALYTTL
ncbi:transglycosylase SLT domain-containing protein [Streptomyces sp. NPDC050095]|uniref:transglycosylase SLT domain-containing protein n=1 Tax=unclassified Streptomyces TaxID=2593676 RepID=UPI00341FD24D